MNQANPVAGNPSETVANAIVAVHAFLMAYPLFAWVLPDPYRIASILLLLGAEVHWWTNDGKCILTQLEHGLRGRPEQSHEGFIRRLSRHLGLNLTDGQLSLVLRLVMVLCGGLAIMGLMDLLPPSWDG